MAPFSPGLDCLVVYFLQGGAQGRRISGKLADSGDFPVLQLKKGFGGLRGLLLQALRSPSFLFQDFENFVYFYDPALGEKNLFG
jgi:hypothetical protein